MSITIEAAKKIRQELCLTHVVIFGIDETGTQHVATHGKLEKHAMEAAQAGNNLKKHLGWPEKDCNAKPLVRECYNCAYWRRDKHSPGFGWQADGVCQFDPHTVRKNENDKCHCFEPKY